MQIGGTGPSGLNGLTRCVASQWEIYQKLISDCLGSCSVVLPRPPQVHNNEVQPPNLVVMRDIVLQCLHNCRGRKMWASETAILPEHADESFIWQCTGEFAIMKIKVGLALPDMPSTIHEGAHNCSCSQEAFHVQARVHDETEWPRSGNGNSRSGVCFLQLTICSSSDSSRKDFLRPLVRKPTLVWARKPVHCVCYLVGADRRATARTMETWSHAAIQGKKKP